MKAFTYTITDTLGIHARPAGLLVKEAKKFDSDITMKSNSKEADLKRLFTVMGMGVKQGHEVEVCCAGADEDAAATAVEHFLQANL